MKEAPILRRHSDVARLLSEAADRGDNLAHLPAGEYFPDEVPGDTVAECRDSMARMRAAREHDWVSEWWSGNRKLWGRLQQVRKGTRVLCPCCGGHRAPCPLCGGDRFLDRDDAIGHLEMEMEMAHK